MVQGLWLLEVLKTALRLITHQSIRNFLKKLSNVDIIMVNIFMQKKLGVMLQNFEKKNKMQTICRSIFSNNRKNALDKDIAFKINYVINVLPIFIFCKFHANVISSFETTDP